MSRGGKTVVVVGGGLAALRACEGLRAHGFDGSIVLCGDEPHLPYDRPPLSKQFLAGTWELDRVMLRPRGAIEKLGLDLRFGPDFAARALDLDHRRVRLASGEEVSFDGLVIATGAAPRRLPGLSELSCAHVLRTIDDAGRLRGVLVAGATLLVVGAGFIGLEVAATARGSGVDVHVVDPLSRPLGRVLGDELGAVAEAIHRDHKVAFHLGTTVTAAEERGDGRALVRLSDGTRLEVDAIVVGIGVAPSVGWLEESGLNAGPDGVVCDASLVAAPGVVAAGDLARFPLASVTTGTVRVEHRTTAAELGEHAAKSLFAELGGGEPPAVRSTFETVLYVWSDQYDTKMQILGHPEPDDEVVVVDGTLESRRFAACYGRAGRLAGVVAFGRPRILMRFRSLLARGASFEEALHLDLG